MKTSEGVRAADVPANVRTEVPVGGTPGGTSGIPDVWEKLRDMAGKRRLRWEERHDAEYDRRLVAAAYRRIVGDTQLADAVRARPWYLVPILLTVVTKRHETVPFILNEVQTRLAGVLDANAGHAMRILILKGRQQGFTSYITAIQLCFSIVCRNFSGFTLADTGDNTRAIFNDKARAVFDRLPDICKPSTRFSSVSELYFDRLGSAWRCSTATADVARSRTLQFVHFSECAFYACPLSVMQAGINQAATADAILIYETTANGWGEFRDLWDSGTCINLFFPWWLTDEYRAEGQEYSGRADGWLAERIDYLRAVGCDDAQIEWYAAKYAEYLDKALIRQEYPCTPEEASLTSGATVFDADALGNRLLELSGLQEAPAGEYEYRRVCTPLRDGEGRTVGVEWSLTDIRFREKPGGIIRRHELPRRRRADRERDSPLLPPGTEEVGAPYVLGGDTAGSGEDWFTGKVIDASTGRVAATLRVQRMDEDLYAEQMLCLATDYNRAQIGIEINYSRHPMRVIAQKYGYDNLYFRSAVGGIADRQTDEPGFLTTAQTKPLIVSELAEALRADPAMESDRETVRELLTFVRKPNGRTEAAEGTHDDLVMALAIANHMALGAPKSFQPLDPSAGGTAGMSGLLDWDGGASAAEGGDMGETDFISWEDM